MDNTAIAFHPSEIQFNGHRYQLMGGKRLYYLRYETTNAGRVGVRGLHVDVWEFHSGQTVPKGWHVHHKDGDTFNNDYANLECLSPEDHAKRPKAMDIDKQRAHLDRIRPKATEWHRSEEGRAWHRENAARAAQLAVPVSFRCIRCGKEGMTKRPDIAKYCGSRCQQQARASVVGWPRRRSLRVL